jgi:anti-anti-sigma regulatory factor
MLRIASRTDRNLTTVKLSGELVSAVVNEVGECYRQLRQQQSPEHITFDLLDVTGIDRDGKRILAELAQAGVWLAYGDPVMQAVVEEIVDDGRTRAE